MRSIFVAAAMALAGTARAAQPGELLANYETAARNLVDNAVRYTPPGGTGLAVSVELPR